MSTFSQKRLREGEARPKGVCERRGTNSVMSSHTPGPSLQAVKQNLHQVSLDSQRIMIGDHLRMAGNEAFMKNDAEKATLLYKVCRQAFQCVQTLSLARVMLLFWACRRAWDYTIGRWRRPRRIRIWPLRWESVGSSETLHLIPPSRTR